MKIITSICWLIVAVSVLCVVVWFATGTLFGIGSNRTGFGRWRGNWSFGWNISSWETLTGPYSAVGSYNVDISEVSSISIDWTAGNISIKPHDGVDIKITEYAQRELRDDEKLRLGTSGDTLTIRFRESGSASGQMPQKRLEVLVPGALSENLRALSVNSVSGSIGAESLHATELKLNSTSGEIYISDVTVTQTIDIDSLSGRITVTSTVAGEMELDSTSGNITVTSSQTNRLKLKSLSGSISVSESTALVVDFDTTSGSITASGAFDSGRVKSLSGRITVDNSAANAVLDANSTSGTLDLSGSYDSISAGSLSGSITIRSTVIPSELKADSTSGSITVTVPDEGPVSVFHSSTSGRFSSDIPVTLQGRGAQFELSTLSGTTRILALRT